MDQLIKISGTDDYVSSTILIDGITLEDIANAVTEGGSEEITLSYDDIIESFSLPTSLYTPEHHVSLMEKLLSGDWNDYSITDALLEGIANRHFINASDLSSRARCEVQQDGISLFSPNFELTIGNMAVNDSAQAADIGHELWVSYVLEGLHVEKFNLQTSDSLAAFALIGGLMEDVDSVRVIQIKNYFQRKGCADIERNRTCVVESVNVPKEKSFEYIKTPPCMNVLEDVGCYHKIMFKDAMQFKDFTYDRMREYREENKGNTYTSLDRAIILEAAMNVAKKTNEDVLPKDVRNILIVGPGLETVNPTFSIRVGQQIYEPFAVIDIAIASMGSKLEKLSVTAIDINPIVVEHLGNAVQAAKDGKPYELHLASKFAIGGEDIPFAFNIPGVKKINLKQKEKNELRQKVDIPPNVVKRIHPKMGDIITDRIDGDGSYDAIVIMNTFMYFSKREKILAMENISRLLKKGGILITDISEIDSSETCSGLPTSNLKPIIIIPADSFELMSIWKKMD